ncbi:MarR family transcriptional regulator [Agrobacterium sp. CNPSo 2736]|uniref:MarR family winged helix-turn-helix transcriptional regulator n=1 Tax=Agrobacterium sp. CNPSo 2736 TaxID=2499627 RepID=UPI000FDAD457|nr:MarR family transcriptional regulator [Agrobacterium sp. CNPSo 2736]RVT69683.1 MarR family transcriptional regulator [Agrobacterium sp. CNPSo 2736]
MPDVNVTDKRISSPDPLVELADVTLRVARKLRGYPLQDPQIVPLSQLECLVLLHVERYPGVTPGDLGEELRLRSSNASTALRGLVEKSQLERRADESDGRIARLFLTPQAKHSIKTVRDTWRGLLAQAGLSGSDVLITLRTLTALDTSLAEP